MVLSFFSGCTCTLPFCKAVTLNPITSKNWNLPNSEVYLGYSLKEVYMNIHSRILFSILGAVVLAGCNNSSYFGKIAGKHIPVGPDEKHCQLLASRHRQPASDPLCDILAAGRRVVGKKVVPELRGDLHRGPFKPGIDDVPDGDQDETAREKLKQDR